MAMTDALSIYLENGTTKAYLKNVLAGIFENYQKEALSARFKSKNANLNRAAGSYEFKRFANSTVRDYGTARTAGKGVNIGNVENTNGSMTAQCVFIIFNLFSTRYWDNIVT